MQRETRSYFCTAVQGLEYFLVQEIREKLHDVEKVEYMDGKIFFSSSSDVALLNSLKSAERILIKVDYRQVNFPNGRGKCRQKIKKIMEDISSWEKCLQYWEQFHNTSTHNRDKDAKNLNISNEVVKESELNKHVNKKIKIDVVPDDAGTDDVRKCEDDAQEHVSMETDESDESRRQCGSSQDDKKITFRITCKCVGKAEKYHSPREFAMCMGTCLARRFGWTIEVRKPKLEIFVNVASNSFLVGFPTTSDYLSRRSYVRKVGIRSTIAWCMCKLADIQPGHILLDPMCASGIIVLEATKSWQDVYCIGCDHHYGQLELARLNIQHAVMENNIQLIQTDATGIPLKDSSIDRVVCDLPFGLHRSTDIDVKSLYSSIYAEITRVVKSNGKAVLLTSGVMVDYLIQIMTGEKSHLWRVVDAADKTKSVDQIEHQLESCDTHTKWGGWVKVETHFLKVGIASAYICVFKKKVI